MLRATLLLSCCLVVARCNPQVLAYERMEAKTEYDAMLARMDSDSNGQLTKAEMEAIDDEWLTDEVHLKAALKADANSDGTLTWDEYLAFKSPPIQPKQEL